MSTSVRGVLCEGVMLTHLVGYDGEVCTWWRLSSCTAILERECVCVCVCVCACVCITYMVSYITCTCKYKHM